MTDFIAAKAIILDGHRLLMVLHQYDGKLMLDLPGGRIEPGEQLEQTVVRECQEELGVELRVLGNVGKYLATRPDKKTVDCTVYQCDRPVQRIDTGRNPADTEHIIGYCLVDTAKIGRHTIGPDLKRFLLTTDWASLIASSGAYRS